MVRSAQHKWKDRRRISPLVMSSMISPLRRWCGQRFDELKGRRFEVRSLSNKYFQRICRRCITWKLGSNMSTLYHVRRCVIEMYEIVGWKSFSFKQYYSRVSCSLALITVVYIINVLCFTVVRS